MKEFSIVRPDDWHLHLRDGEYLSRTVPDAARYFGRSVVMPNLTPPVIDTATADAYRQRIMAALPTASSWRPLMTLYLTDKTSPEIIQAAKQSGFVIGCKLYPAGATTHSAAGVTDLKYIDSALAAMEAVDLPLLVHAEVTDPSIDIFDREIRFLLDHLAPLIKRFPRLRVVVEHLSTAQGVAWVEAAPAQVAATLTVHHLLYNRNDLLAGAIRPHLYCLPILKSKQDQIALIKAAISGNPKFFLGTDSAPHAQKRKESACGCAGIYTAHAALELYAEVFAAADALPQLEAFASFFGADFYGLPRNKDKIILQSLAWEAPHSLTFGQEQLVPLRAGNTLLWKVIS